MRGSDGGGRGGRARGGGPSRGAAAAEAGAGRRKGAHAHVASVHLLACWPFRHATRLALVPHVLPQAHARPSRQDERIAELSRMLDESGAALAEERALREGLEASAATMGEQHAALAASLEEIRSQLAASRDESDAGAAAAAELEAELRRANSRAHDVQVANERALRTVGEQRRDASSHGMRTLRAALRLQASGLRRYSGAYFNRAHRSAVATASFRCLCELAVPLCHQLAEASLGAPAPLADIACCLGMGERTDALLTATDSWRLLSDAVAVLPSSWRLPSSCSETLVRACELHVQLLDALPDAPRPVLDGEDDAAQVAPPLSEREQTHEPAAGTEPPHEPVDGQAADAAQEGSGVALLASELRHALTAAIQGLETP